MRGSDAGSQPTALAGAIGVAEASRHTVARATLDRFYTRVFGIAYQALGDAELAARAVEAVFTSEQATDDELTIWRLAVETLRDYLARGFVVRPLTPAADDWQVRMLQALAQIDPADRILLLLRYHEGLSNDVLAQIWESDEPTIRTLVARARMQVADLVNES